MDYPGRTLPLEIEFGRHLEPPPLNVSHLTKGRIVLAGGRRISRTHELRQETAFVDEGARWENEDLYSKLVELSSRGLPFQYQPKEMQSPDSLMAWWQETGKLEVSFRQITWRGPDDWFIATVEPPVIGIRGWAGPKPFGC